MWQSLTLLLTLLLLHASHGFHIHANDWSNNKILGPLNLASKTLAFMKDMKRGVDPDVGRQTPEFIESRGFVSETHFASTKDGFVLGLHRIVNPFLRQQQKKKRPVILHHGLLASSVDFVENSPGGCVGEESEDRVGNNLGFELAKRGYDVWLANTRGNLYSRNHTILSPKDNKFWDFSYDEMIALDLPTAIQYVLQETNSSKVAYIGHSQGTTIMFGLLSTQPEYSQIVEPFIAMAPVATAAFISTPVHMFLRQNWIIDLLEKKGGEFVPDDLLRWMARHFCSLRHANALCADVVFFFCGGYDSTQLNYTRVPVFQKYDYGKEGNMRRYGTPAPPEYPLQDIDSQHMVFLSSTSDGLATARDLQALRRRLKVKLLEDYVVPFHDWSHIDFIWGLDAGEFINTKVLEVLDRYPV